MMNSKWNGEIAHSDDVPTMMSQGHGACKSAVRRPKTSDKLTGNPRKIDNLTDPIASGRQGKASPRLAFDQPTSAKYYERVAVSDSHHGDQGCFPMRCVEITGSDDRMDCRDMFYDPINPLRRKCAKCGFPDLDHLPQPYFLIKSRTMSPNELALAENGNFLIRDRVRRMLDVLVPGQAIFFPTHYKGTSLATPWLLAVPSHQVVSAKVAPSIPRCEECGEPRSAHPGTQWSESLLDTPGRSLQAGKGWTCELNYDLMKSATWGSSEDGWHQWISRDVFMSVRLLHLLKKFKARGFYEATCQKPIAPDKDESEWIKGSLRALKTSGIPFHADGTLSETDARWFRDYIKSHRRDVELQSDINVAEKRLMTKLPKSYVDFVKTVGPVTFENVDELEGFAASILPPDELGIEPLADELEDEESKSVKGLTFANTDHGDCFCFDVRKGTKEFPVFLFKHEYQLFEPYAENFAACIKRFAGGSNA
jgi:hypothetical protein